MANRNAFIKYVVEQFTQLGNHGNSAELVKEWLTNLSDVEFEQLVSDIEAGKTYLTYVVPNDLKNKISLEEWIKFGESIGAPHYSTVIEEDPSSGQVFESNETHWIAFMPQRSQIQHVDDKKSVAEDSNKRDLFTGQVTGESKGSAVSAPQFASILSRNCVATALEFAKFRGGDIDAGREFNKSLIEGGEAHIEPLLNMASKPTVTYSISAYLNGMHLANNLVKPKE